MSWVFLEIKSVYPLDCGTFMLEIKTKYSKIYRFKTNKYKIKGNKNRIWNFPKYLNNIV